MTYVDIGEYASDYVRMLRDSGEPTPSRDKLAVEIAESWCDGNPTWPTSTRQPGWTRPTTRSLLYYL